MKYLKQDNEMSIQLELYKRLTEVGFQVDMEYKAGKSRFDLIIHAKGYVQLIIEVKNRKKIKKSYFVKAEYNKLKQIEKYMKFKVPVYYMSHKSLLNKAAADITERFKYLLDKDYYHRDSRVKEDSILNMFLPE